MFDDDKVDGKSFTKRAVRYVKKYADFFCDLCLQGEIDAHPKAAQCHFRSTRDVCPLLCAAAAAGGGGDGGCCVAEHAFQQYTPSVLAGAVIACSRRAVKIDPIWRPEIERMTRLTAKEVYPAYKHIYK